MYYTDKKVELSLVVPLLNEEKAINDFYLKTVRYLNGLGRNYELIFIDDGSKDESFAILKSLRNKNEMIKILRLASNVGQSKAMLIGFRFTQGTTVITMDADLQCRPDDISKLIEKIDQGFDIALGYRRHRRDMVFLRKMPSFLMNKIMNIKTGFKIRDWGCSMCAARKELIDQIVSYGANGRFIKPLGIKLAKNPIEVEIKHYKRARGKSKYNFMRLMALAADFLINYSSNPPSSNDLAFSLKEIVG